MDYDGFRLTGNHSTNSLMTIRIFSYFLVVFPVLLCFAGCNPQTQTEKEAATDRILQEIGVKTPKPKPTETADLSILENAAKASDDKTDEKAASTSSKVSGEANVQSTIAIKPKTTVDVPGKKWIGNDALPREYWEVQYIGNTAVGFMRRTSAASSRGKDYLSQEAESRIRVSKKGAPIEQHVIVKTIERDTGELITIEFSLEIGARKQSYKGEVKKEQLTLTGSENDQPFNLTLEFRKDYRGPFAVEQSMLRSPLQPKETRKLKYFDPILKKVVDGRLEASDFIITPTFSGGARELLKLLEVRNLASVGENISQSLLWVDEKGEGHKSFVQANDILAFRADPIQAKLVESSLELQSAEAALIPLGGPVERLSTNSEDLTSIGYRFSHRVDEPYRMFTDRVGQRIQAKDDPRTVEVTVYQNGRELNAELENGIESKTDPAALKASSFVPVDLPQIKKLATGLIAADKSISPETASNTEKAYACQRELQKRIQLREFDKQIGTVSNTLTTKQANCIEHACLFASVCRSLEIPTRIALGVIYNRSIEMPAMKFHVWIEILDGARWVPMDSTEDAFPTSIDRIKIRESYFDKDNPYPEILSVLRLLPDLKIQVLP